MNKGYLLSRITDCHQWPFREKKVSDFLISSEEHGFSYIVKNGYPHFCAIVSKSSYGADESVEFIGTGCLFGSGLILTARHCYDHHLPREIYARFFKYNTNAQNQDLVVNENYWDVPIKKAYSTPTSSEIILLELLEVMPPAQGPNFNFFNLQPSIQFNHFLAFIHPGTYLIFHFVYGAYCVTSGPLDSSNYSQQTRQIRSDFFILSPGSSGAIIFWREYNSAVTKLSVCLCKRKTDGDTEIDLIECPDFSKAKLLPFIRTRPAPAFGEINFTQYNQQIEQFFFKGLRENGEDKKAIRKFLVDLKKAIKTLSIERPNFNCNSYIDTHQPQHLFGNSRGKSYFLKEIGLDLIKILAYCANKMVSEFVQKDPVFKEHEKQSSSAIGLKKTANFVVDLGFNIGVDIDTRRHTSHIQLQGFGGKDYHIFPKDISIGCPKNTYVIDAREILKECDLLFMSSPPQLNTLQTLPITSNTAYVLCTNALFYVNKTQNTCTPLPQINEEKLVEFRNRLKPHLINGSRRALYFRELKTITLITGHTHTD